MSRIFNLGCSIGNTLTSSSPASLPRIAACIVLISAICFPQLTIGEDATSIDSAKLESIDQVVNQSLQAGEMAGAVVAILHRNDMVFHRAYGFRQAEPEPLPMQTDTLFDLASITKPVATATSIMILVERGVLNLQDKISDHIPEFGNGGKEEATIQQLLLHTGGLIPDNALSDYQGTFDDIVQKLYQLKASYPPGQDFRYSDVGFEILGLLIQRKTGLDVNQFSQQEIFKPLKMAATTYLPDEALRQRAAATEKREGRWMLGEVHDPRAYAMGGVAGHAGLFSTAEDLAIYARMMLGNGTYQGTKILAPETVRIMTAEYQVPRGKRGLGWDKRSGYSSNRGETMTRSAFGHGGFTGTAMWIDPDLQLAVIFLSTRLHPDGKGTVNPLAGVIGTIAANAVRKKEMTAANEDISSDRRSDVLCGIDVLQRDQFKQLQGTNIGLITNQTGVTRDGIPTGKVLKDAGGLTLKAIFSPEHGLQGKLDQSTIADGVDEITGLPIFSLYGANRAPTDKSLEGIDTLVFDIQDIGTRFYTYVSTMGNALEVASKKGLRFVVLDRPNPINGVDIGGPLLDEGQQSFVAYHNVPLRHGMTAGELAKMIVAERKWEVKLDVIAVEQWRREQYFDQTGLYWVRPSPNMRTLNQAILYPGIGLIEFSNISVGRGTDTPFERIGAPWLDARRLIKRLSTYDLKGVCFVPERFTPSSSKFENQECFGFQILVTDRSVIDPLRVGLAIAHALAREYPEQWQSAQTIKLLGSKSVLEAILQEEDFEKVFTKANANNELFRLRRSPFLIYR
jgi:uncharacterized protein YbbC (DUF1343 family)/CubicO group peptidase (beta-lactamase class C family)